MEFCSYRQNSITKSSIKVSYLAGKGKRCLRCASWFAHRLSATTPERTSALLKSEDILHQQVFLIFHTSVVPGCPELNFNLFISTGIWNCSPCIFNGYLVIFGSYSKTQCLCQLVIFLLHSPDANFTGLVGFCFLSTATTQCLDGKLLVNHWDNYT